MTTPNYVVILNNSGNLGKSTLGKFCYKPRMNDALIIPIETLNAHEHEDGTNLKGSQYGDLIASLVMVDNAIIDVGSSNMESFLKMSEQYEGSHETIDYYVVPVTPQKKQIKDTISTIIALSEIGVPANKIRVVFNMVEDQNVNIEEVFSAIFDFHKQTKSFVLNKRAVVYETEFFTKVLSTGGTVESILADDTDYNALIKAAPDSDEKYRLAQKRGIRFLANSLNKVLDTAFAETFKD